MSRPAASRPLVVAVFCGQWLIISILQYADFQERNVLRAGRLVLAGIDGLMVLEKQRF